MGRVMERPRALRKTATASRRPGLKIGPPRRRSTASTDTSSSSATLSDIFPSNGRPFSPGKRPRLQSDTDPLLEAILVNSLPMMGHDGTVREGLQHILDCVKHELGRDYLLRLRRRKAQCVLNAIQAVRNRVLLTRQSGKR
jgi:hypothetical protein